MKSKIRIESLGIITIAIILMILGLDHRVRVEKYKRGLYALTAEQEYR